MNARFLTAATLLACGPLAFAAAPRETAKASVGGKLVSVEYGRPALKDRKLDELLKQLSADRIWRAGSEQVTTLSTSGDVTIGGVKLPAGKYSLYVYAPESGDYALAVNKDPGTALGKIWAEAPANLKDAPWPAQDYATIMAQEVARVPMKKGTPATPADLFTAAFAPSKDGQTLTLSWGDSSWSVDVK